MPTLAIVGSGPAGWYTAEAAAKLWGDGVRVDVIDRLPTPFGLIRAGVAPDHQAIKAVARRFDATALAAGVRFVGDVTVGRDVSVAELAELYDAVVFATGAPVDRPLGIPGDDLPGVIGSAAFVGWYNGHPDFADLVVPLDGGHAVVIGNGNVALDVARILTKTPTEFAGSDIAGHALDALSRSAVGEVTIVGRRRPAQTSFTPKELGELGDLARATPTVDPADLPRPLLDIALEPGARKAMAHLRAFARGNGPTAGFIPLRFAFFARPVRIEGDGRAERLIVERTRVTEDGAAVGTGVFRAVPAGLIVACIGYRTSPIAGVAYDERAGRFVNEGGHIGGKLWCVGWARRGPTGTIGTNRPDGFAVVDALAAAIHGGAESPAGPGGLDALLAARGISPVLIDDWRRIDAAEVARARAGAPREKFSAWRDLRAAAR